MVAENPDSDHDCAHTNNGHGNTEPSHLRWVFIGGGIAITGLLIASIWWPNLTERTKFFTGNLLNLVIALAVIAQVLIYRKQWRVMQNQTRIMNESVNVMVASVTVSEGQRQLMEIQAEAAVTAARTAQTSAIAAQESSRISAALFAAEGPDMQIDKSQIVWPMKSGEPLKIMFGIRNAGSRKAVKFSIDYNTFFTPVPFFGSLPKYQDSGIARSLANVSARGYVVVDSITGLTISDEQLLALTNRTATFFVYGILQYADGQDVYRDAFCRMFNPFDPPTLAHCTYGSEPQAEKDGEYPN
jgi:hypothetical protein